MGVTTGLVGREEELAAVERLFDATDTLPRTLVLHGQAGIGKTSLWLRGNDLAAERGCRVLSCRPSEAETGLAFSGVGDLLGKEADALLPKLPPVQRRALEAALLLGDVGVGLDERAVAAAFLAALRLLAADAPVCVAVDDVQWLDAESVGVLGFGLARLEDARVASLVTVRGAPPEWLRRAVPEDRLRAIAVDRLTLGATHELLRSRLGVGFARPTLIRIWETSGGNPFFALELGGALQRRGTTLAPSDELPISSDLDELLQQRLADLTPVGLEVARAVAALVDPTTALVEPVVGSGFEEALGETLDARVLELDGERLRFTHPLLGSAVSSRQTPSGHRSLHARLAEVVPTSEERARHLARATALPDREIAVVLEDAARSARARGATTTAAELAEQSLRLTPADDLETARRRLFLAADCHSSAGDPDRASALLETAREKATPGVDRAEVLAKLAARQGGRRVPQALYEQALVEAKDDPALEATIHLGLSALQRWGEGIERGAAHADEAFRAAARSGEVALRCAALSEQACWQLRTGRGLPRKKARKALALERTLPNWPLDGGPADNIALELMWMVELGPARTILLELLDVRRDRGDAPGEAVTLWTLAMVEWRAGNWDKAEQYLGESVVLKTERGRDATADFPTTLLAAYRGRVDEARSHAELGVALGEEMEIGIAQSGSLGVLGFLELSLGDPQSAVDHLRRCYEIGMVFMREPAMQLELGDYLEALIGVGELAEADELVASWEERARAVDRAWALAILARARGLLLAARQDLDGSFIAFERAIAEHTRADDPFQYARTLLALGRTQRRAKRRGDARATLQAALAQFETLGAPLWAEQTGAELARIGGRTPSRAELTEAEKRIAGLVAEGRTNKEVAASLFLTVHSVETALTRIYRKLGVRSRSELAHTFASNS